MAQIKISSLDSVQTLTNDDVLPIVNDNDTKKVTLAQLKSKITEDITSISFEIVQTLPTTDISTSTIYLVPKSPSGTNDVYTEYVYINSGWEKIGETQIELSNYALLTDVLSKTNTTSYTPTNDYNPSTKKYVDDSITSAITDALGGSY